MLDKKKNLSEILIGKCLILLTKKNTNEMLTSHCFAYMKKKNFKMPKRMENGTNY